MNCLMPIPSIFCHPWLNVNSVEKNDLSNTEAHWWTEPLMNGYKFSARWWTGMHSSSTGPHRRTGTNIYIDSWERVWIVDFNVWGARTDGLLFDWKELMMLGCQIRDVKSRATGDGVSMTMTTTPCEGVPGGYEGYEIHVLRSAVIVPRTDRCCGSLGKWWWHFCSIFRRIHETVCSTLWVVTCSIINRDTVLVRWILTNILFENNIK